jgi:hypothetical protein
MIVKKQMECRLTGETEVLLGENLPQRHFCPSQNPIRPDPGLNPGRRGGKPATNRLSYGAASSVHILVLFYSTYEGWRTIRIALKMDTARVSETFKTKEITRRNHPRNMTDVAMNHPKSPQFLFLIITDNLIQYTSIFLQY